MRAKGDSALARPSFCRRVAREPHVKLFKPQGIPMRELQYVTLAVDELEALRLADLDSLYHDEAAVKMGISRQTFGRIIATARKKVTGALVEGNALAICGGNFTMKDSRSFLCHACGHLWDVPFGAGRPNVCESCQSANFHRSDSRNVTGNSQEEAGSR